MKLWFKRVSVPLLGATGLAVAARSVFVWCQVRAFNASVSRVHIPLVARSKDPGCRSARFSSTSSRRGRIAARTAPFKAIRSETTPGMLRGRYLCVNLRDPVLPATGARRCARYFGCWVMRR